MVMVAERRRGLVVRKRKLAVRLVRLKRMLCCNSCWQRRSDDTHTSGVNHYNNQVTLGASASLVVKENDHLNI